MAITAKKIAAATSRKTSASVGSRTAGAALPARIGDCRLVRQIGEGGMGTVYLARQESPPRDVALKVVRSGRLSRRAMRRFEFVLAIATPGRLESPPHGYGETTTRNTGRGLEQVPFFGDIPIIGILFQKRSHRDARGELLIFMTPRIVNRAEALAR